MGQSARRRRRGRTVRAGHPQDGPVITRPPSSPNLQIPTPIEGLDLRSRSGVVVASLFAPIEGSDLRSRTRVGTNAGVASGGSYRLRATCGGTGAGTVETSVLRVGSSWVRPSRGSCWRSSSSRSSRRAQRDGESVCWSRRSVETGRRRRPPMLRAACKALEDRACIDEVKNKVSEPLVVTATSVARRHRRGTSKKLLAVTFLATFSSARRQRRFFFQTHSRITQLVLELARSMRSSGRSSTISSPVRTLPARRDMNEWDCLPYSSRISSRSRPITTAADGSPGSSRLNRAHEHHRDHWLWHVRRVGWEDDALPERRQRRGAATPKGDRHRDGRPRLRRARVYRSDRRSVDQAEDRAFYRRRVNLHFQGRGRKLPVARRRRWRTLRCLAVWPHRPRHVPASRRSRRPRRRRRPRSTRRITSSLDAPRGGVAGCPDRERALMASSSRALLRTRSPRATSSAIAPWTPWLLLKSGGVVWGRTITIRTKASGRPLVRPRVPYVARRRDDENPAVSGSNT